MAKSWIGQTGRKYDRFSNGVVCGHETATNVWTKGLIAYKTASIDTFDGKRDVPRSGAEDNDNNNNNFISYIAPFLLINQ